jgi:hypothetical protein
MVEYDDFPMTIPRVLQVYDDMKFQPMVTQCWELRLESHEAFMKGILSRNLKQESIHKP